MASAPRMAAAQLSPAAQRSRRVRSDVVARTEPPGTKRTSLEISVRRSRLGAFRRYLSAARIRAEPRRHAHARRHSDEIVDPRARARDGGGTRQRQRAENALAAGGARATAARELLSHRYFRAARFFAASRNWDRWIWSASWDLSAPISMACRKWRRGAAKASGCWFFSSAARSGILTGRRATNSCAKCARSSARGCAAACHRSAKSHCRC